MPPLIETESLTKLYGVVMGVNDLSLHVPLGVCGLLGPNGAGKSTLLKLVTGQLRPTEGTIRVLGEQPWNNPGLFRRVGFCPEYDGFYMFLTGLEFVTQLARMHGMPRHVARERAREALGRVGASEFMERKIGTYSKGMRQRTKLAQALVHEPQFVVLDEPLSGLDPVGRHEVMELIKGLGQAGKSVLVSSHVLHEVQAVTEEFLLIYGGRVLASGNVHEIRGLMNEYAHHITIRCQQGRRLAERLVHDVPISGLELDDEQQTLQVRTQAPREFYQLLPQIVTQLGISVHEVISDDDNLEAVFKYLVGRN